ncbi:MAG: response regulator [Dehalococcoidales bacterium]|nr:response regulator [Dehalococcoidales bacterium]
MVNNEKDRSGFGNPEEKLILIVDDDESIWDLLYYIVRREGFRTEKASDGKEALEKAKLLHPELILLDLMLPKCGGFEIVRELQDGDTSDIPVILLSSRPMDRSTLEVLKQEPNVKDFLEKPVKSQVLAALLHTLLKTRPSVKEGKQEP